MARKDKTTCHINVKPAHKTAKGHQPHRSGAGEHRNVRLDKKIRRSEDRRASQGW
jgi:hypothetical protein